MKVQNRIAQLKKRILLLEEFQTIHDNQNPTNSISFTIKNSELENAELIDRIKFFKEDKSSPFVYFFELENNLNNQQIHNKLEVYRHDCKNGIKSGAVVKLPKNARESTSSTLYVGSVKSNMHTRILGHLGYGHHKTYSLKLNKWFPENLELGFHWIKLPKQFEEITSDIEASLNTFKNPLLGKRVD